MLGLGETNAEVLEVMRDLRARGVDILTVGQYLRPSPKHLPIVRYATPKSSRNCAERDTRWASRTWNLAPGAQFVPRGAGGESFSSGRTSNPLEMFLKSFAATVFAATLIWADGPAHSPTLTGRPLSPTTLSRSPERGANSPWPTCRSHNATPSVDNGPDRTANLIARPKDAWPQALAGFKVELYATDLGNPRLLRTAPNGDLFLADSEPGKILVFRA